MASTLPNPAPLAQEKRLSEIDLRMAKVSANKVCVSWDRQVGQAIEAAIARSNRTQKEVWMEMGYTTGADLSQWCSGDKTANFAKLFAIEWLRIHLVICLAGLCDEVQIETTLRMRL